MLRMSDYLAVLPDEVVAEKILWRLPIKAIIRCRCVCKSWYSLITSRYFISTHLLRKTLTSKDPQIFLNRRDYIDLTGNCVLLFDNQDYFRSISFKIPHPPQNSRCLIKVVGSVAGLICFSIGRGRVALVVNFVLCNPWTGHFQSIPWPGPVEHQQNIVKGFGFDESTLDHIILFIISCEAGFIYSLNSKRWTRITRSLPDDKDWRMLCDSAVFVNGRFHWLARGVKDPRWNFIMVVDAKCESFYSIPFPQNLAESPCGSFNIMEFGESSIAVSLQTHIAGQLVTRVWMMKEYGSVESWIMLTLRNPPPPTDGSFKPKDCFLGFRNKDQVFIRCANGHITLQKINHKLELEEIKKMANVDKRLTLSFSAHKYVPSLVLLDKQNNFDVAAPTHTKRITTV